jgi:hypothetical protein
LATPVEIVVMTPPVLFDTVNVSAPILRIRIGEPVDTAFAAGIVITHELDAEGVTSINSEMTLALVASCAHSNVISAVNETAE